MAGFEDEDITETLDWLSELARHDTGNYPVSFAENDSFRCYTNYEMEKIDTEGGDVRVASVMDDSPAARAGLQTDDRIVATEGESTKGMTPRDVIRRGDWRVVTEAASAAKRVLDQAKR